MGNIKDLLDYPFYFKYVDKSSEYFVKMHNSKKGLMVQPYDNRIMEVKEPQFNSMIKSNLETTSITKIKEIDFTNMYTVTTKKLNTLCHGS